MQSHLEFVGLWIWKKEILQNFLSPGKQGQQQKRIFNIDYSSKWGVNTRTYLWALLNNTANEDIADRTVNFVSCA